MSTCSSCSHWKHRDKPGFSMLSECTRIKLGTTECLPPFIDSDPWLEGEEKPSGWDEDFLREPKLHTPFWFGCKLHEEVECK